MIIFLSILAMSIIGFVIHLYFSKGPKTKERIIELLLLYQLIFSVGLVSFLAFYGLIFMPEYVADYLGWPPSPFMHELANVNLAFGVLGVMCIWFRGDFWLATIVGLSIWLLGDAIGHIYHMVVYQNYSPGNAGIPLYSDVIVPIVLIVLYAMWKKSKNLPSQLQK